MSGPKECPTCGADISGSYEEADPTVGIYGSGWYCETCGEFVEDDDDGSDDYEAYLP